MRPIVKGNAAGGYAGRPGTSARFEILQGVARQLDVAHEDAQALGRPVAGVADVQLNGLAGIGLEIHFHLLPAAAIAGECVPGAGAPAGVAIAVHVVRQEGMDLVHLTGGATQAGAGGSQAIHVGQRCPAICANLINLDEGVVPVAFGIVERPELQARRTSRDREGTPQSLEG